MFIRVLVGILMLILLAGCATPRRDIPSTTELQNRIKYLETELRKKDQELSILEDELERLSLSARKQPVEKITSPSVKKIQTALRNAGFYKGSIDGKMGPQTRRSVKEFQKANGLKADGIVGRRTWERLSKYLD